MLHLKKRETTPPVARWLRDLDIWDARASLANLNPEQFEDVTKAVTALDRIGRLENKLLTAQRDETFAETVERLRAATEKHHGLPGAQSRATDQKGVGLFAGALASLDRVETLLRQADGLEEQGPFWEAIYLPAQRAYEAELVKGKAAKEAIEALLDKHFKDKKAFNRFLNEKLDTGMIDPGTEKKLYWTGENLLCAMLNWRNQHTVKLACSFFGYYDVLRSYNNVNVLIFTKTEIYTVIISSCKIHKIIFYHFSV